VAYVAIENIATSRLTPWRPVLVFAFGLLHGMGFADVLMELRLPRGEFIPALISFNAGIELGQLTVIAIAFFSVTMWYREKPWYRPRFVVPACTAIAAVGLFWAVQRIVEF
jgi:HupE / UreJ protein